MTKLLSDAELDERYDSLGIGLLDAATGGEIVILETILVQAKLANRIQKQAAEICLSEKVENDGNDGDTGYNMACDHCHKAILAMEIEP